MIQHTFRESLAFASNLGVREQLDELYRTALFPGATVTDLALLGKHEQHRGDVRVTLRGAHDTRKSYTLEEKIRDARFAPTDLLIETTSAAQFETAGWVYTSEADWIVYARVADGSLCSALLLPFEPLQRWFVTTDPRRFEQRSADNGSYRTLFRIVPLAEVPIVKRWLLEPTA